MLFRAENFRNNIISQGKSLLSNYVFTDSLICTRVCKSIVTKFRDKILPPATKLFEANIFRVIF